MSTEASSQPVGSQPTVPPMPAATVSRTWEVVSHLVAFSGFIIPFGNVIGPLVIWLMKKAESPSIEAHAKESLNFQISMTIWTILCGISILVVVGVILVPAAV